MNKAIVVLMLMWSSVAVAQTVECPETEAQRLQALLTDAKFRAYASNEFGADLEKPANIITYDHFGDQWSSVYTWESPTLSKYKGDAAASGDTLQVELPAKATALMFLTRSNPFFFRGLAKPIEVASSDDVKQLETFASLAGNFLTGFIGVAGKNITRAARGPIPAERAAREAEATAIRNAALELRKALQELERQASTIGEKQAQTVAYAQMIDQRKKPEGTLPGIEEMKKAPAQLSKSAADVRVASNALRKLLEPYCPALVTDATAALALLNGDEVKTAEADVRAAKRAVERAKPADKPALETELQAKKGAHQDAVDEAKVAVAKLKATNDDCTDPRTGAAWREAMDTVADKPIEAGIEALENIIKVVGGGDEAIKQAAVALAKEPGALRVAGWLADSGTVAEVYGRGITTDPCRYVDSPVLVRSGAFTATTGKKLTGGFTIASTVEDDFIDPKRPATLDRKVEVTATSKWGLGVGVVYTPLELKSWTVNEDKIVSKAAKETISGQTALFVNYHPGRATWRRASFGAQAGFNTSTDKPAVYGGVSVDVGKWLRLGTGYSFHRNQRLGDGLKELTALPEGDSLRTEDYFPGAWYASLSLSLDGIPLFQ